MKKTQAPTTGKVANVRYYEHMGKTYMRTAKNSRATNPRTPKQMRHRMRFASTSAIWREAKPHLKGYFVHKLPGQSDTNLFVHHNRSLGVYFTRDETWMRAQVMMPCQVSEGNLPSINCLLTDGRIMTDIALGVQEIDEQTTIGEFATAVVGMNDSFERGDRLEFASFVQTVTHQDIPHIRVAFHSVRLVFDDHRLLWQVVPRDCFMAVDGHLGTSSELAEGCYGYIHVRDDNSLENNIIDVSTQTLVNNNQAMIDRYSSAEAFDRAFASYGGRPPLFIEPEE